MNDIKHVLINLQRKTLKQCIQIYRAARTEIRNLIHIILQSFIKVFKTFYQDIALYRNTNTKNKVFNTPELSYHIFQYCASSVNELNTLSLVDCVWMMYAFNGESARYIDLNVTKSFCLQIEWTFERFAKGVKTMKLEVTNKLIHNCFSSSGNTQSRLGSQVAEKQIRKQDTEKCGLFWKYYTVMASKSKHINIVMVDWKICERFEQLVCDKLFHSNKINCFKQAEKFLLLLRLTNNDRFSEKSNCLLGPNIYYIKLPNVKHLCIDISSSNIFCFPVSFASTCEFLHINGDTVLDTLQCCAFGVKTLELISAQIDCYAMITQNTHKNENDQNLDKLYEFGKTFTSIQNITIRNVTQHTVALLKGISCVSRNVKLIIDVHDHPLSNVQNEFDLVNFIDTNEINVQTMVLCITTLQDLQVLQKLSSIYNFNHHLQNIEIEMSLHDLFDSNISASFNNESYATDTLWGLKHISTVTIHSYAMCSQHIQKLIDKINVINNSRNQKSNGKNQKLIACKLSLTLMLPDAETMGLIQIMQEETAILVTSRIQRELKNILNHIKIGLENNYVYEIDIDLTFEYTLLPENEKFHVFALCTQMCSEFNQKYNSITQNIKIICKADIAESEEDIDLISIVISTQL